MSAPFWAVEAAEEFWELAGGSESFPRALRRPIADAVPLSIVSLPRLRLRAATVWLRERGIVCALEVGDRPLQAALVARYDTGFLFLDGSDDPDELRFSLAHELAHYLRHYRQLRRRVAAQLGPSALEVLDGDRPPSRAERIHALLANVPIGYYVHLMGRDAGGGIADGAITAAEREADRLAYELLAPAERLLAEVAGVPVNNRRAAAATALVERYGLPAGPAAAYAALLVPAPTPRDRGFLSVIR